MIWGTDESWDTVSAGKTYRECAFLSQIIKFTTKLVPHTTVEDMEISNELIN